LTETQAAERHRRACGLDCQTAPRESTNSILRLDLKPRLAPRNCGDSAYIRVFLLLGQYVCRDLDPVHSSNSYRHKIIGDIHDEVNQRRFGGELEGNRWSKSNYGVSRACPCRRCIGWVSINPGLKIKSAARQISRHQPNSVPRMWGTLSAGPARSSGKVKKYNCTTESREGRTAPVQYSKQVVELVATQR
jgi:hypothetical protein